MNAMDGQKARNGGRESLRHGNGYGQGGNHFLGENLLSENSFQSNETVGSDGHFHAKSGANQIRNGRHLIAVEMNGDEQEHLAETPAYSSATATPRASVTFKPGSFVREPLKPSRHASVIFGVGEQAGTSNDHGERKRDEFGSERRRRRPRGEECDQSGGLVVGKFDRSGLEGAIESNERVCRRKPIVVS